MEYYKKEVKEIFEELNISEKGLSDKDINSRTEKYGLNVLPKKKKENILKIFFHQINDPIIYLLFVASLFSFIVNEKLDAFVILFIVFLDAFIGMFEEVKARKNAESLQNMIKIETKVLRNGKEVIIDSSLVVPGDIVLLESGGKVPADLRIFESKNLTVDESILTGESISAIKNSQVIKKNINLSDRANMLYAGTSVMTGRCKAIVVEIGSNTEIGKIASTVSETKEAKSPLKIRMEKFSKQISLLVLAVAVLVTISLVNKGFSFTEIFLSVVALSVSAMPEGLPLAMTMALTVGSNRMSKKKVIVKKLNAVESLGSCTVIASDKTGTLTVNEQTAKKIILPDGKFYEIEGEGYNENGKIIGENFEYAEYISKLGFINNEAVFKKEINGYQIYGDSIDIAFLVLAKKLGVSDSVHKLEIIPYESENKYSAVFYREENKVKCTAKGSPEKIIEFCNHMFKNDKKVPIDKEIIIKQNAELAREGFRVIALCDGEVSGISKKLENLTFIGLVAFIDPVRRDAKKAIKECFNAGIKVIMITGDHPLTASSIAKELNLIETENEIASSDEIERIFNLGEKKFDDFIRSKKVFSRVTPVQKLEIINSLKRQGEFVAVTGDGVNDAPAIKSANLGIAMGSGTDVAKETAQMIIMDDSFKSIVTGIKEGRIAYNNIRKISYLLLSCGIAEVLFFLLSMIFNLPLPLLAIQLLWLNVVTDGLQDIALSLEKEDDDVMKDSPRNTKESIFNGLFIKETLVAGTYIGILVFVLWIFLIKKFNVETNIARGYIMAFMVFLQNMHVLNCRSEKKSVFKYSFKTNPFVIVTIISATLLQILIMEVESLSKLLKTHSIRIDHLLILFVLSTTIIGVMEIFKKFNFRKNKKD